MKHLGQTGRNRRDEENPQEVNPNQVDANTLYTQIWAFR